MNTDFRICVGFFDHHKTRRLISALGLEAAWSLLRLWEFAAVNKPDGSLKGMTETEIAASAHYPGDALEWVAELERLGWLDSGPTSRAKNRRHHSIHEWLEHQPYASKAPLRRAAAAKAAEARWKQRTETYAEGNAGGNADFEKGNAVRNAPSCSYPSGSSLSSESSPEASGGSETGKRPRRKKRDAGRAAPIPGLPEFREHARASFCALHRVESPPWDTPEWAALTETYRRKLRADLAHATATWDRFLAERAPQYSGHDPKLFRRDIGKWVGSPLPTRGGKAACLFCGCDDADDPINRNGYHRLCDPANKTERAQA